MQRLKQDKTEKLVVFFLYKVSSETEEIVVDLSPLKYFLFLLHALSQ